MTKFNDTWVVELEVMNGGKNNAIGPIPVILFQPHQNKSLSSLKNQFSQLFSSLCFVIWSHFLFMVLMSYINILHILFPLRYQCVRMKNLEIQVC